jgi:predicted ArsR family transcriptional regulator
VYVALTSHRGEEAVSLEQLAKEVGTTPEAVRRALDALHSRGWGATLDVLAPSVVERGSTPA